MSNSNNEIDMHIIALNQWIHKVSVVIYKYI